MRWSPPADSVRCCDAFEVEVCSCCGCSDAGAGVCCVAVGTAEDGILLGGWVVGLVVEGGGCVGAGWGRDGDGVG